MGDVAVTVAQGGTGLATIATGGILYASATNTYSRLAPTAANQVLRSTAANALQFASLQAADIPDISATYSAKAGNTGLITLGTITSGTWHGTAIDDTYITSASTWNGKMTNPMTTVGDLVTGGTAGAPTRIADVATGSYLGSGGVGVAPAWTAGRVFKGYQVLTSGTTYTPTAGTSAILIKMCGAGGGGGGANAAGTTNASLSGGGGSGGYLEKFVTFSTTAASYTVNIPAGGAGGVGVAAGSTPGSNTTFACNANCSTGAITFTAYSGGGAPAPVAAATTVRPSFPGTGGVVSTNGDINSEGAAGMPGQRYTGAIFISGKGGNSIISGGGDSVITTAGGDSGGPCSGGAGAASHTNANQTGGAGGSGAIIIMEFD